MQKGDILKIFVNNREKYVVVTSVFNGGNEIRVTDTMQCENLLDLHKNKVEIVGHLKEYDAYVNALEELGNNKNKKNTYQQKRPVQVGDKTVYYSMNELRQISERYDILCIMEYIQNNHPDVSDDDAEKLAYETRRQMNKYDYDEGQALQYAADELGMKTLISYDYNELD